MLDASEYWIDQDSFVARLGRALPRVPAGGSVQVELNAGMVATFADLPADLAQAIMMLSAHYYEYRNDTSLSLGACPLAISSRSQGKNYQWCLVDQRHVRL